MIQKARRWLSGLARKRAEALRQKEIKFYGESELLAKNANGPVSGHLINRGMAAGKKKARMQRLAEIIAGKKTAQLSQKECQKPARKKTSH